MLFFYFCLWALLREEVTHAAVEPSCYGQGANLRLRPGRGDSMAGAWEEPGSLVSHGLRVGQTQSCPEDPLNASVYEVTTCPYYSAPCMGGFLFLEGKNVPYVRGRFTFAHYYNSFRLVSKDFNFQSTTYIHVIGTRLLCEARVTIPIYGQEH